MAAQNDVFMVLIPPSTSSISTMLQKLFLLSLCMIATPAIAQTTERTYNSGNEFRRSGLRQASKADEPVGSQSMGSQSMADRTMTDPSLSGESSANELRAEAVEVKYINKVDVPANTDGVLIDIVVEEGNLVDENQVLAIVDDKSAKLTVELKRAEEAQARHKAKDDVNLRDAQNNEQLAKTESTAFRKLAEDGAVPFFEWKRKELEAVKQTLRIELAEMEGTSRKIDVIMKQTELEMAEAQLDRCLISAPTSGYIEERLAQKGQWVQAGTPICTLIQMDKLRVQGTMSGLSFPGQITKGQRVLISIDTSNEAKTQLDGVLGYVSMEMDVNGQHRVWAEVQNQRKGDDWLIKPGMRAEIVIPIR